VHLITTINPYSIVKEARDREDRRCAQMGLWTPLMLASALMRREVGGADRDRTDDPLLAKQMLSQLSYSPGWAAVSGGIEN
jgi:hypothetical protein